VDTLVMTNGLLRVIFGTAHTADGPGYYLQSVDLQTPQGWKPVVEGTPGGEFATASNGINATECEVERLPDGGWRALLSGKADGWEASEVLTLAADQPFLRREQTYRFTREAETAICPGFRLHADSDLRYTFPLRAHEQSLANLPPMRSAVDWALPFPFHVWHNRDFVALYGLDKRTSPGTLDFQPIAADGYAAVRVYYLNPPPTCRAVSIQPSGPLGLRVKGWRSIAGAGLAGDSPRTVPLDSSEAVLPLSPGYSRVGVGLAGVFDR